MLEFLCEELKRIEEADVIEFPNPKIYKDVQKHRKLGTKAQVWGGIYGKSGGKFAGVGDVHDFGEPVDVDTAHSHFQKSSKNYEKFKTFGAAQKLEFKSLDDLYGEGKETEGKPDLPTQNLHGPMLGVMGGSAYDSNEHEFKTTDDSYDNFEELEKIASEILKGEVNNE